MDELSEADKLTVEKSQKDQRFAYRNHSPLPKFSPVSEFATVRLKTLSLLMKAVLDGKYDHLPEKRFCMV